MTRINLMQTAIAATLVWIVSVSPVASAQEVKKPNIVFIMVDDLGKEWISAYGAEKVETPNIDQLASEGMRLTNAWSMPQCTPTRVTLLTGQYPYRNGWTNHFDVPRWGSGCHFDPEHNASFARVLRQAGYATAIAGKWQIDDFRVEPRALGQAGFDRWCVWTGGEGGNPPSDVRYWDPYIHRGMVSQTYQGKFGPDIFNDFLIGFAREHRDEPMLLYYPMCLTHGPLVSTPDEPDASGREGRFKAMVRYTDKLVGKLVDTFDELGLRERTIFVFTTDNGSPGGVTGVRNGHEVRGAKSEMREAGVAMPFIVRGPGLVPEGVVSDALTDFTDILPTFAELGGTEPADGWVVDGHSIAPVLLGRQEASDRDWIYAQGGKPAAFRNNRVIPAQPYDDRVIRNDRWKLWVSKEREPTKLYDMERDPWETNNLIGSDDPAAMAAKEKLWGVVEQMPKEDAAPRYDPNPPQPWDRFDYEEARTARN